MSSSVHDVVILAAGNGDRFRGTSQRSKLLTPVAGVPLLVRTLQSARQAGLSNAHIVIGFDAERIRALACSRCPVGLKLNFYRNDNWHKENGVSVLTTRSVLIHRPFALLMGDHLFEPRSLMRLLNARRAPGEILLGVDCHSDDPRVVSEATKVRIRDGRIVAIGKDIGHFDALDTGLFVCDRSLFDALEQSCGAGDTTLSAGVSRLAAVGKVRGCDIGTARWQDIDTVADLEAAEDAARLAAVL
jgi:choline kinase